MLSAVPDTRRNDRRSNFFSIKNHLALMCAFTVDDSMARRKFPQLRLESCRE
jgi:hypothetical protein